MNKDTNKANQVSITYVVDKYFSAHSDFTAPDVPYDLEFLQTKKPTQNTRRFK